jgi:hypothetical protein
MPFESWRDYWDFARETARERRFIRSDRADTFLNEVAATSPSRIRQLKKGTVLWRAQLGHGWRRESQIDDEVPSAFDRERMKPQKDRAKEGRVNAKGVPCLYLATTRRGVVCVRRSVRNRQRPSDHGLLGQGRGSVFLS